MKLSKDREEKVGLPRLWLFVLLVLGALILGDLNQRMADARHLENEAVLLEDELWEIDEDIARLEQEIAIANTEEYIERWAHKDAKWIRQGETLVILVSPESEESTLGAPEESEVSELSNMEVWLKLLFKQ